MSDFHQYCTLSEVKQAAEIDTDDVADDDRLDRMIEAVSRAIDKHCRRRFYAVSETRLYTAEHGDLCLIDDLVSLTSLKTDDDGDRTFDETWAATDYILLPANAALHNEPYTRILTAPRGSKRFPGLANGVQVIGSFGYSTSTPPEVREACLLWSLRVFMRRHAVFGVKGSTVMGEVTLRMPPPDPDVALLLRSFRRGDSLI